MIDTYTGELWVPGHPVSKGSLRCVTPHVGGRRGVLVPEKTVRDPDGWKAKLPDVLAWKAQKIAANPIDDPVELRVDFYLRRPATTAFPVAPVGHGSGDLDKLTRMVGDAVGGSKTNPNRLITDDSRIARIVAEKFYAAAGQAEGAKIELCPYLPPDPPAKGMPVTLIAGRNRVEIGAIRSARELPALLRAAADQLEEQ
jgi:Holliday junction resolvase RusA-like endonuclease